MSLDRWVGCDWGGLGVIGVGWLVRACAALDDNGQKRLAKYSRFSDCRSISLEQRDSAL